MSLSISESTFPHKDLSYDAGASRSTPPSKTAQAPAKPDSAPASSAQTPAKPTEEQRVQRLVAQGESNQQIATALGLTVTQVEQSLAGTSTAATSASSVVALAGRLSIKV